MIDLDRVKNTKRWQGPVGTLETFPQFPLTQVQRPGKRDMIACGNCAKKIFDVEGDGDQHDMFHLSALSRAVSDHAVICDQVVKW